MIQTDFLKELDRFHLIVSKRVTSNYRGARRSMAHGRGVSLKDYRKYTPGDDFRLIDWRIFARTDKLHIKLLEEDRSMTTHILLDHSGSMHFGRGQTKADYAAMLGIGFAYLTLRENEKFQFSTFAGSFKHFQPKRGTKQLLAMVDFLNSSKVRGKSDFKNAMSIFRQTITTRSLVVIISDFLFPLEEFKDALVLLGNHDIKLIQVLDPVEKDLSLVGDYKFSDAETDGKLRVSITPKLRSTYQQNLDNHVGELEKFATSLGVGFYQVTTDTDLFDAFYDILA